MKNLRVRKNTSILQAFYGIFTACSLLFLMACRFWRGCDWHCCGSLLQSAGEFSFKSNFRKGWSSFKLYWRANLSSPSRTGNDGLLLDILELIWKGNGLTWDVQSTNWYGLLCPSHGMMGSGFCCSCTSKPQQLQMQGLTAGKRQILLIHLQGLMCRKHPARKEKLASLFHTPQESRCKEQAETSPVPQGAQHPQEGTREWQSVAAGLTQTIHREIISSPNCYLSTSS